MLSVFDKKKQTKVALFSVTFMLLIDGISYALLLPLVPALFLNNHEGFYLHSEATRTFLYSLCLAIYPLTQFFGITFFGTLSDKWGRRSMILIGLASLSASYFLSVLSIMLHNFTLFFISRACQGFMGSVYSVGNALVCDLSGTQEKQRLFNFRLTTIAAKLGTVLGPCVLVLLLMDPFFANEFIMPFLITALLCALNFILIFVTLKNLEKENIQQRSETFSSFKLSNLLFASQIFLRHKNTLLIAVAFFLYQCGANLFINCTSLYLIKDYHLRVTDLGIFNTAMSSLTLISIYCVKFLIKGGDVVLQLRCLVLFIALLFVTVFLAHTLHYTLLHNFLVQICIISGIFFITVPIISLLFTTVFSEYATENNTGLVMGALGQLTAFGYIVSSLFIGHVETSRHILAYSALLFGFAAVFVFAHIQRRDSGPGFIM